MKGEIRQTVQPHSVLICKVKAEKRLEPVCYEAEWAYLPCYDDLGKKSKPIVYVPDADCSGKMKYPDWAVGKKTSPNGVKYTAKRR